MKELDLSLENQHFRKLQLFVYLVPIVGFFPSLWTLYRRQGSREQQVVSRLSVTLAFAWLLGYVFLSVGFEGSEVWKLRLLFTNSMLTSTYFLVSIGLMVRLWQGKQLRLTGISRIAEGIVRKRLS